jgi:hypothetical protein
MNEIFFIMCIVVIGVVLAGLIWDLFLIASLPVTVKVNWERINQEKIKAVDRQLEVIAAIRAKRDA